jgi:uncharacterized protein
MTVLCARFQTFSSHRLEQVARALIEAGADKDKVIEDGRTALFMASMNGHAAVVKILLEAGADATLAAKGYTAQSIANTRGHSSVSAMFLSFS